MDRREFLGTTGLGALAVLLTPRFAYSQPAKSYRLKEEFMEEVDADKRSIHNQIKLWEHIERWSVRDWAEKASEIRKRGIEYPMNNFITNKIGRLEGKLRSQYPGHRIDSSEFRKAYETLYAPFINEKLAAYKINAKGTIGDIDRQIYDGLIKLYSHTIDQKYDLGFIAKQVCHGFQAKGLLPSSPGADWPSTPAVRSYSKYALNIPNYSLFIHSSHIELTGPEPEIKAAGKEIQVSVAESNSLGNMIKKGKIEFIDGRIVK